MACGSGAEGCKKSLSSTWGGVRTLRSERDALTDVLTFIWSSHRVRNPRHEDQTKFLRQLVRSGFKVLCEGRTVNHAVPWQVSGHDMTSADLSLRPTQSEIDAALRSFLTDPNAVEVIDSRAKGYKRKRPGE